jgi:hypothetical protein
MSLISGPPSFSFTGGGITGFWPFQLITPASITLCIRIVYSRKIERAFHQDLALRLRNLKVFSAS